jgi:diacylglycerol kinase (ATP)
VSDDFLRFARGEARARERGPPETFTAWNFLVANGRFAGGIEVAPGADTTDGQLDLIIIQDGTPLEIAQLATGLIQRSYRQHELVVHRRVRQVSIRTSPPVPAVADGETLASQRLEFSVLPLAVRVVTGPGDT